MLIGLYLLETVKTRQLNASELKGYFACHFKGTCCIIHRYDLAKRGSKCTIRSIGEKSVF